MLNPAGTVEAVVTAVIHPVDTYNMIAKSIPDSYERDMVNGDSYSRAHWVSYAVGTVVTSIFGTKGAGSITKTGVATTKVAVKTSVTKAGQTVKGISLAEWLPYAPKHQIKLLLGYLNKDNSLCLILFAAASGLLPIVLISLNELRSHTGKSSISDERHHLRLHWRMAC